MAGYIILIVLVLMLVMLIVMTYQLRTARKDQEDKEEHGLLQLKESDKNKIPSSQTFIYTALVLNCVMILVVIYFILKGTIYEGHLMEWLNIIVRLMHITFGIAWIGASFYFVFLENALNRTKDVRDELAGNLWAVHGGGFYYLEKYKAAPRSIPKHLHWFKYEAYFTWLSGFCLLMIVYYFNASAMLVDNKVMPMSNVTAVLISLGSFIAGWIIYDILCRSALIKKKILFTVLSSLIAFAIAYFYCSVFSARAAYIHFGALLGSIMVANVFFVIIPSQKAMVKAATNGSNLNPLLGKNAGMRSLHNNYLTLPVLFVMISNHFPSTFGSEYPWLILAVISLGTAGVKHYLNLKEKGILSVWVMPASVLVLLAAVLMTAPSKPGSCNSVISYAEVNTIFQNRCVSCHSSAPSDDFYSVPPLGVVYDVPADLVKMKDKIMHRVVITKTMPLNNKTGITQEERDIIRCWIDQGASLK